MHTVLNPFALPKTGFCGLPGTVSLCYLLSFHLLACVCWCDTSWAELSFCCAKGWGSEWETPCRDREALCFGHSCDGVDGRLTFCLCFPFHLLKFLHLLNDQEIPTSMAPLIWYGHEHFPFATFCINVFISTSFHQFTATYLEKLGNL